jgi:hypothetical protein
MIGAGTPMIRTRHLDVNIAVSCTYAGGGASLQPYLMPPTPP